MALMDWDESLDVGVDSMNNEHKQILRYMNELHDLNGKGASRAELSGVLKNLADVTVRHFADEEAYMESVKFEGLKTHKIIHQDLLKKFIAHKETFEAGGNLGPDFFNFLRIWLSAHIRGIDMKYGKGLGEKAS